MVWSATDDALGVAVRFVGREDDPRPDRETQLRGLAGDAVRAAWPRQTHSSIVLAVGSNDTGMVGEADALHTREAHLALGVVTADCLPILVAGSEEIAAIHAGWRGLVNGIVPRAIHALGAQRGNSAQIRAWIGPAIGACCYEVSPEVVTAIVTATPGARESTLTRPGPRGRPHLDLLAAGRYQLIAAGINEARIESVGPACTRCHPNVLWSYRGDGANAGRNSAWVWRR